MAKLIGNAVVGQSGGPTAVINQSLVGVILEARKAGHIQDLLGARHGVRGIINNDFLPLKSVPTDLLERIALTPAAALGSTRDKPDQAYCQKIFESFSKNNVRHFFYIGGNDSADTARIVSDLAKQANYELRTFHIPKTIDNDLRVHDHTPGYGSAARFVASAMIGDNYDNKSLPGIKIDVIMGRHAGFLTAASVLARRFPNDGPHLVYVPEAPLSMEKLLADVDAVYSRLGRCLIAVSEGVCAPDGKTWAEKMRELEKDAHGNVQLSGTGALGDYLAEVITRNLQPAGGKKLRVRADTFGYLQRSFPGYVSKVDAKEARLVGRLAVKYSGKTETDGSVAMRRLPGERYAVETFLTPLETVARETRHLAPEYIEGGNNITQAFIDYARPLVGELPEVGTFDEL
jgi:6-phosphofructokinase